MFDQVGDVACCPVGDFCRGVVNNDVGADVGSQSAGGDDRGRAFSGVMRKKGMIAGSTTAVLLGTLLAVTGSTLAILLGALLAILVFNY